MYVSGGVFLYCITAVEVMLTGKAVEQISNPQESSLELHSVAAETDMYKGIFLL